MGTVTKTIGSSGGRDYSTIQAWEDALPANLVTDGNSQVGQCFNDTEFTTTGTILTISGETTDATHTITLTTGAGQSFRDNANKLTNALAYNQSNGVGIRATAGSYATVIAVQVSNVFFANLQIKGNSAAARELLGGPAGQMDCSNCIFDGQNTRNNAGEYLIANARLYNCLVVDRSAQASANTVLYSVNGGKCVNTDFISIGATGRAIRATYASATVTNCAFFGPYANNLIVDHGTITYDHSCTDNAGWGTTGTGGTLTDGGSNLVSKTFANQFQSTTTDFRAKAGADLLDAGATDTTDIPTADDIVGTSRPQGTAWDIGCWELAVASGSNFFPAIVMGRAQSLVF